MYVKIVLNVHVEHGAIHMSMKLNEFTLENHRRFHQKVRNVQQRKESRDSWIQGFRDRKECSGLLMS